MSADEDLLRRLRPLVREVAEDAGRLAMRYFQAGSQTSARIWSKSGGSPVTEADVAVDTFLKVKLSQALPAAGWLSEETTDDARRLGRELVWIVDPIDGTRAFMNGNADWSVAIGLLVRGTPMLGIVHAPAHDTLYEALRGEVALRNGHPIAVATRRDIEAMSVTGPVPFIERLAHRYPDMPRAPRVPSLALRIARVAEGSVDIGLISTDARDWDIAAADVILTAAGGALFGLDGKPAEYNRVEPVHGELVAGPAELQPRLIEAIRPR